MPDMTLMGFATFLAGAPIRLAAAEYSAMERAAKLVQAETRHEIGTYQSDAGPFAAWAELADSTKQDRVRQGFTENDPGLRTGEMQASIGYAVGVREAAVGSDEEKMEWFELGTSKQPPRSALGGAAFRKAPEVAQILGQSAVMALLGVVCPVVGSLSRNGQPGLM